RRARPIAEATRRRARSFQSLLACSSSGIRPRRHWRNLLGSSCLCLFVIAFVFTFVQRFPPLPFLHPRTWSPCHSGWYGVSFRTGALWSVLRPCSRADGRARSRRRSRSAERDRWAAP